MTQRTPLYLIDASIYIFRAYFSIPETLVDTKGRPVNAVYGYTGFLARLLRESRGRYFGVTFDESLTRSFRNDYYPPYKANRDLPPPELEAQLKSCQAVTRALGLKTFVSERYEADDLVGTLARKMRPRGFRMVYVSSDKDLTQLMRPGDIFWDFARNERLRYRDIKTRFGVRPEQMADYLALTGDAVDNIPGVPGIGAHTASILLARFRSLDKLYACLDRVTALPLRGARGIQQKLERYREQAYLSRRLARIHESAPLRCDEAALERKLPRPRVLEKLFDRLGFGRGLRERVLES